MKEIQAVKELDIFGKTVRLKNYGCSKDGGPYFEKEPPFTIKLSICPTQFCAGGCPFCVAANTVSNTGFLDIEKLRTALLELKARDIISTISITGGEPFTDVSLLNEIVEAVFEIFGLEMQLSINTNGIGLGEMRKIRKYLFIDTIHISRHHYDDDINRRYFNLDVPTEAELTEIVGSVKDKRLFVFNCLLLKDGIGTKEEAKKFMEFADRVRVPKVGFVTVMPINPYTEMNRVSYMEVLDSKDPDILFRKCFKDYEYCHCTDGIYAASSGRIVHFYGRETEFGGPDFARGLVYTSDNELRTGYGENAELIKRF